MHDSVPLLGQWWQWLLLLLGQWRKLLPLLLLPLLLLPLLQLPRLLLQWVKIISTTTCTDSSFIHSLIQSFDHSITHSFIQSFIHPSIHPFTYTGIHVVSQSSIRSFTYTLHLHYTFPAAHLQDLHDINNLRLRQAT